MDTLPKRFYSLDVLRGMGALTIVLTHWPGFFYYQGKLFDATGAPFYHWLKPVYDNGWRAVDLFFCLSGFVFFLLYSEKIKNSNITAKEFFSLRFSRLYPLHLVTLLLVAGGQIAMVHLYGSWFVIGNNDWQHFFCQIFFIAGAVDHSSFNGPVWSVTVEIILYGLFFVVCRSRLIHWWQILIYIGLGQYWFVHHGAYLAMSRGVLSFFIGGLAFQLFRYLNQEKISRAILGLLTATTLLLWVLVPQEVGNHYIHAIYLVSLAPMMGSLAEHVGHAVLRGSAGAFELVLFPLTIITLALLEARRGTLGRRFALLGDISYSTYLLHFPLQILFMISAFKFGIGNQFFSTPLAMAMFFLVLIPLSVFSHHYVERPAQSFLRAQLLPAKPN